MINKVQEDRYIEIVHLSWVKKIKLVLFLTTLVLKEGKFGKKKSGRIVI